MARPRLTSLDSSFLRVETPAEPETSPVAPRPMLTIVAAILGGLLLAAGVVVAALDRSRE